jgi:hypothetical protein
MDSRDYSPHANSVSLAHHRRLFFHGRPGYSFARPLFRDVTGESTQRRKVMAGNFGYEPSSKRRKGFASETNVKRGFPYGG